MLDGASATAAISSLGGPRPDIRRSAGFVAKFNHAGAFQLFANPTTLAAPIQGVLVVDDKPRRLSLAFARNSHTPKENANLLNAFSDEPESTFRIPDKVLTCLLTPDFGDCHLSSISFILNHRYVLVSELLLTSISFNFL